MYHKPVIHFLFCIAAVVMASAQEEIENITLQFVSFPQGNRAKPVELLVGEGETIKVNTPSNEFSKRYTVPNMESIVLGETTLDEEGNSTFSIYGQGKHKGTKNQIVLLLKRGKEHSDGFVVHCIDADETKFGGASFLFINVSKIEVGGKIGDTEFSLEPGQQEIIKPEANHSGGVCQVTFAYKRPDKWKTFHDTRWPAHEKVRAMVFFYQNPKNGKVDIAPIMEVLPY